VSIDEEFETPSFVVRVRLYPWSLLALGHFHYKYYKIIKKHLDDNGCVGIKRDLVVW
jgi:hypothetical protein